LQIQRLSRAYASTKREIGTGLAPDGVLIAP
jgi:hypothetical protein